MARSRVPMRTAVAASLLLLLPVPGLGRSTEGTAAEEVPREIVALVLSDWPPQYSLDEEGVPRGFAVDVMDAVAARAGLRVRYRVVETFPEALDALRARRGDVIPNLGITKERGREFAFTEPVETFNVRLFIRAASSGPRGWEDLGGRVVGVVRSNAGHTILSEWSGPELEVFDDVHTAVLKLLAGQVDALVYPEPVIRALARKAGLEGRIQAVGEPLVEISRGIGVRPDDRQLLARLQVGVDELVGSPEYERIYSRWHGEPEPLWTTTRAVWAAAGLVAVLLVAVLLWRYRIVIRFSSELRDQRAGRRRAEREAQESRVRFRAVAESLAEGLMIGDLEGRITYVNPRFEQMTGYRRDECVGRHALELLRPGDQGASIQENLERRKNGLSESYETRVETRDGSTLWVEVHASPLVDASGEITGAISALVDVTARKWTQQKLHEREEQLRQVQRIEALGRLAGGVAHDFNNLLTAINGYGDLLVAELAEDDPRREHALTIRRAGESAASLTRQLMTFSRHRIHQPGFVDLHEAVREVEPVLRRLIEESIEIVIEPWASASTIVADPSQIESVLLNLAINARDAMDEGGKLTLRIRAAREVPVDRLEEAAASVEDWIVLEVEDTGKGMEEAVRRRIFDPFFTTKEQGAGTGLGLASVYGIVTQGGGTVEVESEPGGGALFRVFFPWVEPPAEEEEDSGAPASGEAAERDGGTGRLLVVEDETQVRRLLTLILRNEGYEVLEAGSGAEALSLCDGGILPLDALVTDLVMPGIGGEGLAARLRERMPELKVLFTSGYTEKGPTPEELRGPDLAFLQKPFQAEELVHTLRTLLGR